MQKIKLTGEAFGPLKGIKIIDLSRLVAGNYLSFHLAEMGAEVIKVENPKSGDPLRQFTDNGISNNWKVFSRNKKSLAINLKSQEGQEIILGLMRSADALIENFKPGGLEKFGLSPESLFKINPSLIIVRISGWGQTGPYSHKPGFGTLIEAFSGFAAKSGFPNSEPLLPNLGLADMITGSLGAYALMAALREVEVNQGKGQVIDLSLLESMASFMGADPATSQATGKPIPRVGNGSQIAAPRNLYRTRDDYYLAISASMQSMAEKLFIAIGEPALINDPRFNTNASRVKNREALDPIIASFVAENTLAENLVFFEHHGITAGEVNDSLSILKDAHIIDRQVFVEMDDADCGSLPMPNVSPRFSNTPGRIHSPAPTIGEHSKEILNTLGFDASTIERFAVMGIIK